MNTLIDAQNVTFKYDYDDEEQARLVLDDINLKVRKGEFLAIIGHNGSGKSTLAKHFNAMLLPLGGRVLVLGMDTTDEEKQYDIRQNVGLVLQNPDNQIVATIVEEDVAFAPENLGVPPEEIRKRVDEALKTVNMYEYRKHAPHRLSGGQKQRVAIAGIFAMRPQCIVLDEPTAMLDPQGREEVLSTILHLNKQQSITVVLITHYMNEAVMADRVVAMHNGKQILEGTPRKVFSNVKLLKSIGLDVPQATELVHKLKEYGFDVNTNILNTKECIEEIARILEDKNVDS